MIEAHEREALGKVPQELKDRPSWVVWRAEPNGNRKLTKIPVNPKTGQFASVTDPGTWGTYVEALRACLKNKEDGIRGLGFVFTAKDPFCGVDLDNSISGDGKLNLQTQAYVDQLWSYTEITPSGRGLHVLLRGRLPGRGRKRGNIEIYDQARFFTITGAHLSGTPTTIEHRQKELETFYQNVFGKEEKPKPIETKPTLLSDKEALEKASNAKNGDKFNRLWTGDYSEYPSQSEADLALCFKLAFWCGNNPEQIDQLFRQSGLYRQKWDKKHGSMTYGQLTIKKAVENTNEAYSPAGSLVQEERPNTKPETPEVYKPGEGEALKIQSRVDFNRTDLGNAERLAAQYGNVLRYNWTTEKWLYYDGIRWNPDKGKEMAHQLAYQSVRTLLKLAMKINDPDRQKKVVKHAFYSESWRGIKATLDLAKAVPPFPAYINEFDTDQFLLNVQNGTIDLRTGKLREHNPDDMITKLAPVTWNGEVSNFEDGQRWLECCNTWMAQDDDAIDYLQRLGGMCLTGITTSRVFPIFWGTGKNGKNVFLDTLMKLMGDYATVAPRTLLKASYNEEHATEVAGLVGMRLVVASETKRSMKLKTTLVKSMTGDTLMKARFMRQDYFDFTPTFKVILITQNLPVIDETTDAIWDRVQKVEWGVRIPNEVQDPDLLEKLKLEWPYILGWFIQGCLKWQEDGYLKPTRAIMVGTQKYRDEMHPIKGFLEECCITGPNEFAPVKELKEHFDEWTPDKKKMNSQDFNSYMVESCYLQTLKKMGGKPVRCWRGLRLREKGDD